MDQVALFSDIVERIYDAALDAELWPGALERICAFVQGCGIALIYASVGPSTSVSYSWGYAPRFLEAFENTYSKINPFYPALLFLEIGEVFTADEIVPMREFVQTRLYKEWAKPQGLFDAMQVNLERTATGAGALSIHGRERDGLFDANAKSRLALIVPHVRRAIAIGKVVEFHRARETALEETLDRLDSAVLLVANDGRLVHVNSAGNRLLTTADILRAPQGRLAAADPRANAELRQAIADAARGDANLGVKGVAISLAVHDGSSHVAHVLSLASEQRRKLLSGEAAAAVFVRRLTSAIPAPIEIIARRYGLTPAEVRVLASIAASSGVADIGRILGIGEATVKTHLHRLFSKTGAKRQADLVKLLAVQTSPSEL